MAQQAAYQPPRQYERSRLIQSAPGAVYDYVSEVGNLPTYLPTVRRAERFDEERVRITVDVQGEQHEADGFFRGDPEKREMGWGSDPDDYRGWLVVSDEVDHARVIVRLTFTGSSRYLERIEAGSDVPDPIDQGLEAALDSIKNILEGEGGKVEAPV